MQNRIIQWNCRGLKANYEETLLLLKDYEPAALCLQETHLKETDNVTIRNYTAFHTWGWSGGAMVLGNLPVPGRPTNLITVGQGPIALAVGAGGGGLDIFTLIYPFFSFSLSLGDGPI